MDQPETWHRDGRLLYTLVDTGQWRKGAAVLVNRLMVHVTGGPMVKPSELETLLDRLQAFLSRSDDKLELAGREFYRHIPTDYLPSKTEFRTAMLAALNILEH